VLAALAWLAAPATAHQDADLAFSQVRYVVRKAAAHPGGFSAVLPWSPVVDEDGQRGCQSTWAAQREDPGL